MSSVRFLSFNLFSPSQITGIVLLSLLLAAVIGVNIWLVCLLRKRGAHKLYTAQLRKQRAALMKKLYALRSGEVVESTFTMPFFLFGEKPPQADPEADETDAAKDGRDEEDRDGELDEADDSDDDEENETLDLEVTDDGKVVRYDRSFTARITQSDNDLKARYSELKNYILQYRSVKSRISWKKETFRSGRNIMASFVVSGKTLCVCLATDPKMFEGTKYRVDDLSRRGKNNKLPCRFRITSDRRTKLAKELIDVVMAGLGLPRRGDYVAQNFVLPYRSTEALVKRRAIKVMGDSIPDFAKEDALAAQKRIRYNRSFEARIIQSDDMLKGYYSAIKNRLLSYEGVDASAAWRKETFSVCGATAAALVIRGKTLCVCLALDPARFDGTKYKAEDISQRVKNTPTPLMYRIKNARRVGYAVQLIDKVFSEKGAIRVEKPAVDYAGPFVATDTLVRRGLIKVIGMPQQKDTEARSDAQSDSESGDRETIAQE